MINVDWDGPALPGKPLNNFTITLTPLAAAQLALLLEASPIVELMQVFPKAYAEIVQLHDGLAMHLDIAEKARIRQERITSGIFSGAIEGPVIDKPQTYARGRAAVPDYGFRGYDPRHGVGIVANGGQAAND